MNRQKAKNARVFGWFCVGLSIVLLALYAAKSLFAGDRDVSPALPIIGMALLVAGITRLASAKKASQNE
jgi:hypothetical protein